MLRIIIFEVNEYSAQTAVLIQMFFFHLAQAEIASEYSVFVYNCANKQKE